jgi:hypothetical protein
MHRIKSTIHPEPLIIASFYSSDDDVLLGSNQEEAPASTHDVVSSSTIPKCRGGVPS